MKGVFSKSICTACQKWLCSAYILSTIRTGETLMSSDDKNLDAELCRYAAEQGGAIDFIPQKLRRGVH